MTSVRVCFLLAASLVLLLAASSRAVSDEPHDVADALRMLEELDRYYTQATRPRYGKRSDVFANWAKEYEKGEAPSWLALVQRR